MAKYLCQIGVFCCLWGLIGLNCKKASKKKEFARAPYQNIKQQPNKLSYWAYIYAPTLSSFASSYLKKIKHTYDFFSITGLQIGKWGDIQGEVKFFNQLQAKAFATNKVFPLITPLSASQAKEFLASTSAQKRAIRSLLVLTEKHSLAGVQIDFEGLSVSFSTRYQGFLHDLKNALHQKGKRLSMALFPQVEFPRSLAGLHKFHSYRQAVDEVVLMAYDYSQKKVGPVTSVAWAEANIRFLLQHLSKSQIYLGIPLYGYSYSRNKKGKIRVVSQKYAEKLRQKNVLQRHASCCMLLQTNASAIYYPDMTLMRRLLGLAQKYSLKGLAFWRLGFESKELYPELNKERVY